jgi:hypothetical protein
MSFQTVEKVLFVMKGTFFHIKQKVIHKVVKKIPQLYKRSSSNYKI